MTSTLTRCRPGHPERGCPVLGDKHALRIQIRRNLNLELNGKEATSPVHFLCSISTATEHSSCSATSRFGYPGCGATSDNPPVLPNKSCLSNFQCVVCHPKSEGIRRSLTPICARFVHAICPRARNQDHGKRATVQSQVPVSPQLPCGSV